MVPKVPEGKKKIFLDFLFRVDLGVLEVEEHVENT